MIINASNLAAIGIGFSTAFRGGFENADNYWQKVAMRVVSGHREEKYGWLGQLPALREWIGDRVIYNLSVADWTIKNKTFESTIEVDREQIEDDTYGVYTPVLQDMGANAKVHPDSLVFALLKDGFTSLCYDGQYFFDSDHPVVNAAGAVVSVSNVQAGAGEPWFLLDTSRAIRPFVFQERIPYQLVALDRETDENVFMRDKFLFGVRARANVGFGLWQLAFGSKDTLDADNYEAARAAMMGMKGDGGRTLNIKPKTLVVGPALEKAGLTLVNAERDAAGATNVWKGTADLIVVPWLS